MSENNYNFPEWLDEELFKGLEGDNAPPPAPEGVAPLEARNAPGREAGAERMPDAPSAPRRKASDGEAAKSSRPNSSEPARASEPAKKKKPAPEAAAPVKKPAPDKSAKKRPAEKAAPDKPERKKTDKSGQEKPDAEKSAPKKPRAEKAAAEKSAPEKSAPAKDAAVLAAVKKKKKRRRGARGGLIALIVVMTLAILVCAGAAVGGYLISQSDTNLPNVYLGEVYVGGMTKEQTVQALEAARWETTAGGTLTVTLPEGVRFEADYLRAGVSATAEEAAEKAFAYGHTGDWVADLMTYVEDLLSPKDLGEFSFSVDEAYVVGLVDAAVDEFERVTEGEEYSVNEEESTLEVVKGAGQLTIDRLALRKRVVKALLDHEKELEWTEVSGDLKKPDFDAIAKLLTSEVKNAEFDPETGEIIPDVKGVAIDMQTAARLWEQAGILEKISIPITLVDPEVTAEQLQSMLFRDKLGDCLTYLAGSSANRISNIRTACSRFDGLILMPGERFDYNQVVGERTLESGFKYAPAYDGTEHVDQIGGGICQVSSTLYNAALYANLEINDRSCHNMVVTYLPKGLDATVSWGGPEFVFTNSRDFPVKIKAWVDDRGRELTIEIWGTDVDGSYVDMLHYEWPAYDDTYPDVQVGYGARSIRRVYHADGTYTDGPNVYSYYSLPDDEIHWPDPPSDDDGGDDGGGGGEWSEEEGYSINDLI